MSKRKKPLRCIVSDCNGTLTRLQTHNGLGYEIMYFRCRKCKDLTYILMNNGNKYSIGDAYHRGSIPLSDYQQFLESSDMEIVHRKDKERKLQDRIRELESRVGLKGVWKGLLKKKK